MWENTLSQKIVDRLCEQNIISISDANAYVYGYELLISSTVSVLLVVLVSIMYGDIRYSISFLIGFVIQRIYLGGYHAITHTKCYLAFTGIFFLSVLLSDQIIDTPFFRIITTSILLIFSMFFSPVEATNKPLGKTQHLKFKLIASLLSAIDFILALLNVLPNVRIITVYYISKWALIIFVAIPLFTNRTKPTTEDAKDFV